MNATVAHAHLEERKPRKRWCPECVEQNAAAKDLLAACEEALSHAEIDADDGALALEALAEIRPLLRAVIARAKEKP